MRPVISRTFFVQNTLISLSVMLAIVGFIFFSKDITIIPSSFGSFTDGNIEINLFLGIISLPHLACFTSFLFIYLIFEFYGLKPSIYTAFNAMLAVVVGFVVIYFIKRYSLDMYASHYDEILTQFIVYDKKHVFSLIIAFLLCNVVALFLAFILKKIMRNYFMFIRFPLVSSIGFAVFVFTDLYLNNFNKMAPRTIVVYGIEPALQFLILILASVAPLYILRLLLGIFRGWNRVEDTNEDLDGDAGLFKGSQKKELPLPSINESAKEINEDDQLPPPPEDDIAAKLENTVSKKIRLETKET